jgi:Flp pilus assembly CpaF family ATPase/intein/homing endonuclease
MGEKKEGKRKEIERLLKIKEEPIGGKEVLSQLLGEPSKQAAPPAAPKLPAEQREGFVLSAELKGKVEKVLDRYGSAEILKLEGDPLPLYRLRIPELTEKERELLATCKRKAVEEIKVDPESIPDPSERRRVFMQELMKILERESKGMRLPSARLKELSEMAFHDMIGYGPLDLLIADDKLEDILVIGVNKPVYVYHSRYGMCSTNIVFEEEDTIRYYIDKMARLVGRRIDHQMPLLDARLPDGSRINATIPPVSLEGPTLSIRKFRRDPLTVVDLMNFGTLSPEVGALLWLLVHGLDVKPANILFAGGTGSGKTTLLNCATTFVPDHERIISIEDTAELQLPHRHWVRLECVHPHTHFLDGRGVLRRVGESFEEEARRHTGEIILSGPNLYLRDPNPLSSVLATALPDLRTFPDRLELLGRTHLPEYWVSIRTADGSRLRLTPNSPLLALSNGRKVELPAERVRVGDYLPVLASVSLPGEEVSVDPRKFAGWRVHGSQAAPVLRGMVRRALLRLGCTGSELARRLGVSTRTLEGYLRRRSNHVPLLLLLRLSELLGENLPPFTRWVEGRRKRVSIPAKLDERLAYLVGVISGNGSLGRRRVRIYHGTETRALGLARRVFGLTPEPATRKRGGGTCHVLDSALVARFLREFFGLPVGRAGVLRVPEVIQRAKESVIAAYLAGLVDSAGQVDPGNGRILLSASSGEAVLGVRYLLCRLGVFSRVQGRDGRGAGPAYRISVSGEDAKRLAEKLEPYACGRNRLRLSRLLSLRLAPGREELREGDAVWCRVTEVKREWNHRALPSYNVAPASTRYYPAGEMGFVVTNPNTRPPNIEGRGEICLFPGSYFVDGEGVLREIGEFVEGLLKERGEVRVRENVWATDGNGFTLLAGNPMELDYRQERMVSACRITERRHLCLVRGEDGTELRVTENTRLPVVTASGVKLLPPGQIDPKSCFLPVFSRIKVRGRIQRIDPLALFNSREFYACGLSRHLRTSLERYRRERGLSWRELAGRLGISRQTLSRYLRRDQFRMDLLHRMVEAGILDPLEVRRRLRSLSARGGTSGPVKVPRVLNEELAYLAGFLLAGKAICGNNLSVVRKRPMASFYLSLWKKLFGITPTVERRGGYYHFTVTSKVVNHFLRSFFGLGKSEARVPEVVMKSPDRVVAAFLAGLIDGNGGVRRSKIYLSTASERFAKEVMYLFLRLGIRSRLEANRNPNRFSKDPGYTLSVLTRSDLVTACRLIPFRLNRKGARSVLGRKHGLPPRRQGVPTELLRPFLKGLQGLTTAEKKRLVYPYLHTTKSMPRERLLRLRRRLPPFLRLLLRRDLEFVRIKEVRIEPNTQNLPTYDLTPETQNFFLAGSTNLTLVQDTMDDLVKNALRMRPDRIIVGEVRGPEARTMFTAMNTGHDGALLDVSVVRLSDGRLELIGNLCESLFRKHSSSIRTYKDLEYLDLPPEDVFEVVSVGPDLRSSVHRVSRVWRRRVREGERLVRLVTRAGHEIHLTHHHPLFVLDEEGEVRRKEAGELIRGDRVACMMRPPPVKGRRELPREALRGLSEALLLPDPLGEVELLGRRYRRVPNDGGEHLPQAEFLVSQNSHPVRLPQELEPGLSYLLGVLLGDGCVEPGGCLSATFDDRGYLEGFMEALRSYLPTAELRPQNHGGWHLLRVGSKILSEMLVGMFNLPRGEKSDGWRLPPLVLGSDDENLAHFLAGLFDSGASVDPKRQAVIFVTKSREAALEVGYALQRLGMLPVVRAYPNRGFGRKELCRVIVRGVDNLRRFAEVIPLRHSKKREALGRILSKPHRGTQLDRIPVPRALKDLRKELGLSVAELTRLAVGKGARLSESLLRHLEKGRTRRVGREALGALAEALWERARELGREEAALRARKLLLLSQADVYWDEVLEVGEAEVGERYVYDLTVEEDHNYEANGLVVSNCMGTLHANSAAETITRLTEAPMSVPPIMIPALDVVVMLQRIYHRQKGHIRRITEIAEVTGLEGGKPQLSRIFKWNPRTDRVEPTGVPLKFRQVLSELSGKSGTEIEAELKRRAAVLEWMRAKGIRNVFEVGKVIQEYYQDPEGLLKRVRGG